ncbi:MAG TPA: hypothetical protein VGR11_12470, partial [Solirubrobacteraceae bacterium]|nr:hypothetical protein [Solirubrobacteraceae bacterium]
APSSRRGDVEDLGARCWRALGGFLRGQTIVALFDAVLIGLALVIIGVVGRAVHAHPIAILLGVSAGGVTAGIIGAMVAAPAVAVAAATLGFMRERADDADERPSSPPVAQRRTTDDEPKP